MISFMARGTVRSYWASEQGGAGFEAVVHQRAAKHETMNKNLHTVRAHFKTDYTNGEAVWADGQIIFILEFHVPLFIEEMKDTMLCLRQYL